MPVPLGASRPGCDAFALDSTPCAPWTRNLDVRATVTIDDDVLELVRRQPRLRRQSLGRTLSGLARRGLTAATPAQEQDGLVMFRLPADSPLITTEDVRGLEAAGE
jgi:hypothetical protein